MEIYFILKIVWWLLLGVLLMGIAVMVGMDMGVGAMLRYVGRNDSERRIALNIIGPHWDGNQAWFILGGGAIFAAWPLVYATAFSGFYIVMLLLLWSMILRPLGFEYRSKISNNKWRNIWDYCLVISGIIPMLIFGIAIGNIIQGVPFHFDWILTSFYTGSFTGLFNSFSVLCGFLSVSLSFYMGGAILMSGGDGNLAIRARRASLAGGFLAVILFTVGGFLVSDMNGYEIISGPAPELAQTPLHQVVNIIPAGFLMNFFDKPILWFIPAIAYTGMIFGLISVFTKRAILGWWFGSLTWIGVISTVGAAMFPFILISSTNPSASLTIWNAGSSQLTLIWMLCLSIIFIPAIIAYTSWAFWVMRGKVNSDVIKSSDHTY